MRWLRSPQFSSLVEEKIHFTGIALFLSMLTWLSTEMISWQPGILYTAFAIYLSFAAWTSRIKKQVEKRLRQSEQKLGTMAEAAFEGLAILSPTGEILEVNSTFKKKVQADVLTGRHISEYLQSESEGQEAESHLWSWKTVTEGASERKVKRTDGSLFDAEVGLRELCDGGHGTFIMAIRDVSARKENEKLIFEHQAQMVASSKMATLGEMAGGIAHEINNPLAVIQINAAQISELLEDSTLDIDLIRDRAAQIEKTISRIAKIINGLKTFARDSSDEAFEEVPLKNVIGDALDFCEQKFVMDGVVTVVDPSINELSITCRPVQLSQVLLNLFNNAYDAIAELKDRWIRISADRDAEGISIRVADSGSGISKAVQERIFHPFFTTKPVGKGTGLGLSISKGIVEGHQGRLEVNAETSNTEFVLWLPNGARHGGKSVA